MAGPNQASGSGSGSGGVVPVRTNFGGSNPANMKFTTTRNILMELRKICQHPYLTAPMLEDESLPAAEQQNRLIHGSGKLVFLKQLLPKLKERGHRVLLFSQFKIALDRIEDFLVGEGTKFLRLDGDTPQAIRQKSLDAFNAPGSDYSVFLLTTRAGGVGINLFTADTVIIYDPDFNPHQDLQAIARAHRYGQQKPVLVFKLMVKDSVEEQIFFKGKKKMVLDHLVVQNLNTAEDEVDIDGIIMHGAKALYEKTDEGKDRGIIYNSKNVDEMIDQVERQAKEEAVVLAERWRLEDEAREGGDKAEPSKEARTFGFAKIWEADQAGLRELQDVTDEMEMEGAEGDMGELLKHARMRKEAEGTGARQRVSAVHAQELARKKAQYDKELEEVLRMEATPVKKKRKSKGKGKGKEADGDQSDADFALIGGGHSSDSDYAGAVDDEGELNIDGTPKGPVIGGMVAQQHGPGSKKARALALADGEQFPPPVPKKPLTAEEKAQRKELRRLQRAAIASARAQGSASPSKPAVNPATAWIEQKKLIKEGQDVIQWLYHTIKQYDDGGPEAAADVEMWAKIGIPELPARERENSYHTLATKMDRRLQLQGAAGYFLMQRHQDAMSSLIRSNNSVLRTAASRDSGKAMMEWPENVAARGRRVVASAKRMKAAEEAAARLETTGMASPVKRLVSPTKRVAPLIQAAMAGPSIVRSASAPNPAIPAEATPSPNPANGSTLPTTPRTARAAAAAIAFTSKNPTAVNSPAPASPALAGPADAKPCPVCRQTGHTFLECDERVSLENMRLIRLGLSTLTDEARLKKGHAALDQLEQMYRDAGIHVPVHIPGQASSVGNPSTTNGSNAAASGSGSGDPVKRSREQASAPAGPAADASSSKRQRLNTTAGEAEAPPAKEGSVCAVCSRVPYHPLEDCPLLRQGSTAIKATLQTIEASDPRHVLLAALYQSALAAEQTLPHARPNGHSSSIHTTLDRYTQARETLHRAQQQQAQQYQHQDNMPPGAMAHLSQQHRIQHDRLAAQQRQQMALEMERSQAKVQAKDQPVGTSKAQQAQQQLEQRAQPKPKVCAFCLLHCGGDLRACGTVHGGRKALKALIRGLTGEAEARKAAGKPEPTYEIERVDALFNLYNAWEK